jgi:hypothetical protein
MEYDYEAFVSKIIEATKEILGEEYSARISKVTKNNSLEFDTLLLMKEGDKVSPNIYLLPYYEEYKKGADLTYLAYKVCDVYRQSKASIILGDDFSYAFDEMKQNIIYRLVNYDKNKGLLEKIPHMKFLDLAITFCCLVHNDKDGIGTILITNEHLKSWGASIQELSALAAENTPKIFPCKIQNIMDMLRKMIADSNDLPDEFLVDLIPIPDEGMMYILSNSTGANGATCLLYENILKEFADQLQSDLFILPSSVHEVILVPFNEDITKDALTEMVKTVNGTEVAEDEILSDKVYIYSRKLNTISD